MIAADPGIDLTLEAIKRFDAPPRPSPPRGSARRGASHEASSASDQAIGAAPRGVGNASADAKCSSNFAFGILHCCRAP